MHVTNLGVFLIAAAEGILFLAETEMELSALEMPEALRRTYDGFLSWRSANKISCSPRPWKLKDFHLGDNPLMPTQHPRLNLKAFNARCVVGWLADSCRQSKNQVTEPPNLVVNSGDREFTQPPVSNSAGSRDV